MSVGPNPQVDPNQIEQARRQVNRLAEEIAQLSETDLPPAEYYGEFIQRVLAAIAAPAGAIWIRTPQGNLQLQYQIRMRDVGLDNVENGRQIHDELLRQAVMRGQPAMLAPQSGLGTPEGGSIAAGNPTNHVVLIAPIVVDKQVAGLVEVWQDPNRGNDAQRGFLQFLVRMAQLASSYTRNHQLRQMSNQQQVWTQLEAFAKNLHGSLNPTEVAYQVANEGRRLIECDRVSVGLREGGKAQVRAISGADIIEKRSNLVQLMKALFEQVLQWGEKLVYSGTKDDTLPPKVLRALDNYLEESNSKLLVVMPLRDDREKNPKKSARSVIMMECFEPNAAPEQLTARMEVVAKHATSALYNAWEHRQIPFRFIWSPLAKVQEGLGGKTKAIVLGITFGLVALITMLILVPYPLKMDADGQLLPIERGWVYAPIPGTVIGFRPNLKSGQRVSKGQDLVYMQSHELAQQIKQLMQERDNAEQHANYASRELHSKRSELDLATRSKFQKDQIEYNGIFEAKKEQLNRLLERTKGSTQKLGVFKLQSPIDGILLTSDFRENLLNANKNPNEPLLRIGKVSPGKTMKVKDWEIVLKIPQKHIGQVLAAFVGKAMDDELDVDFLVVSKPEAVYKGKLSRRNVASQAIPDRTDNNEAEPVVLARVRLSGEGIAEDNEIPPYLLMTGTEVHARVRCGNRAMGYSLFYGVWEFFYEKVVFFF